MFTKTVRLTHFKISIYGHTESGNPISTALWRVESLIFPVYRREWEFSVSTSDTDEECSSPKSV